MRQGQRQEVAALLVAATSLVLEQAGCACDSGVQLAGDTDDTPDVGDRTLDDAVSDDGAEDWTPDDAAPEDGPDGSDAVAILGTCDDPIGLACGLTLREQKVGPAADVLDRYLCDDTVSFEATATPERVYAFTAVARQVVTLTVAPEDGRRFGLWALADACESTSCIAWSTAMAERPEDSTWFVAEAGTTYFVAVEPTSPDESSRFSLTVACSEPPADGTCSVPAALDCGVDLAHESILGGEDEFDLYSCSSGGRVARDGPERAYVLMTTSTQNVVISAAGLLGQAPLLFLLGDACDSAACVERSVSGSPVELRFTAEAGVRYFIVADSYDGLAGNVCEFSLDVTCSGT